MIRLRRRRGHPCHHRPSVHQCPLCRQWQARCMCGWARHVPRWRHAFVAALVHADEYL